MLTRRKGSAGAHAPCLLLLLMLLLVLAGEPETVCGKCLARLQRRRSRARLSARRSRPPPPPTTAIAPSSASASSATPCRRALLGRDSGSGPAYPSGGSASSSSSPSLPLLQVFGVTLMSFGSLVILGFIAWRAFEWYQRKGSGYVEMTQWG
jgi:hypothetical protein